MTAVAFNLEAEQALLGAVLFDNGAYERLPDGLAAEHFHEPFHGRLWAEIDACIRQGRLADPTLLMDRFRTDPAFEAFGGLRYLADLVDHAPPGFNAPEYGRAVIDHARRRELARIGAELSAVAVDPEREPRDIAEAAEGEIYRLMGAGRGAGQGVIRFSQAVTGAVEMAAAAKARDGRLAGLATGLVDLDRMLGGLHPSDLLVLAGRPSMGKTALATNIAFNVARAWEYEADPDAPGGARTVNGGRVLFFSLEMSAEQLAMRILADASGVSSDKLRKGEIDGADYDRFRDAAVEIAKAPLAIDATGGLPIAKLAARARREARQHGLDLIIVDYLQLATASSGRRDANRVEQVSEITGALKALAKELSVPIIALSQLSRQVEQREDKRPQLADLRESGSIEQDADAVMFVYRESYYLARAEPKEGTPEHLQWQEDLTRCEGQAEVVIGKQRHGPIGIVKLAFDADRVRFGNLASDAFAAAYHDPSLPRSEY
ncbi:replicative DNA helicase [Pseudomonas sp. ODNR1LW]|nr:replicative DNA helicase [Pseudomonas sp. ODNR1LW]